MLIYGSAITATHLAGRLQSGDHINERQTSPDVLQPQAAATVGPWLQRTALGGTTAPGASGVLWSFNLGQSAQASLRSAEQQAHSRPRNSFTTSLSQSLAGSAAANQQTSLQYAFGQRLDASYSQADAAVLSASQELKRALPAMHSCQTDPDGLRAAAPRIMTPKPLAKGIGRIEPARLPPRYGVDRGSGLGDRLGAAVQKAATSDQQLQARFARGTGL
ncbi:MAG: hypothetical protein MZU95_16215 [Desulfomicrobium escambiense]|nr:hypothetical protein [Desulfomicrobium escambiense]